MLTLSYATNPHEQVLQARFPVGVDEVFGRPISFNALQDILVGKGALVDASSVGVVFVKHKMPIMAFTAESLFYAIELLRRGIDALGNVEFGTIVLRGTVGIAELRALDNIRFHTIAADDFDDAARAYLESDSLQHRNRGVVGVIVRELPLVTRTGLFTSDSEVVVEDRASSALIVDPATGVANGSWNPPENILLCMRVLALARTISVVVANNEGVVLVRCGFYDGISALRSTLYDIDQAGISASDCIFLTDGCFGVRTPVRDLKVNGVKKFVFCGGKSNDNQLLEELQAEGIGAFCTKKRLFYY